MRTTPLAAALAFGLIAVTAGTAEARDGCGPGFHRNFYGFCRPNFWGGPAFYGYRRWGWGGGYRRYGWRGGWGYRRAGFGWHRGWRGGWHGGWHGGHRFGGFRRARFGGGFHRFGGFRHGGFHGGFHHRWR